MSAAFATHDRQQQVIKMSATSQSLVGFTTVRENGRPARAGTMSESVLMDLIQVADAGLLLAAGAASFVATGLARAGEPVGEFVIASLAAAVIGVLLLRRARTYSVDRLTSGPRQLRRVFLALALAGAAASACLAILRAPPSEIGLWVGAWLVGSGASLALFRATLGSAIQTWKLNGRFDHKVAVIGVNALSQEFIDCIRSSNISRTRIVGLYSEVPDMGQLESAGVRGDIDTLMLDCRMRTVDAIVVAMPASARDEIDRITARLRQSVADLYLLSDAWNVQVASSHFADIGTSRVVPVARKPLRDWREVQKIVFDRVVAVLGLLALLPLLLLVAAAIKLTSPGPVLFRQMRMGFNNNLFRIYKFRTMHVHMTDRLADRQTSRNDRRVTRVGRVLRKLSIDELPQLINVIVGDMSLVGPRPHAPGTKLGSRRLEEVVGGYAQRHRVKPGITGLAQINGFRGELATEEQVRMRVQHDLDYIRNWSLWLDIKIIVLTVSREIGSRRAF